MSGVKITVGYLYPDIMAIDGDRGNVETVTRRCGWRGIGVDVTELGIGDNLDPAAFDLLIIGGGGEARQRMIAPDLGTVKAASIREAVACGTAALAVGGGYELLGRFCEPERGVELRGVQLFDTWTIRRAPVVGHDNDPIFGARAGRRTGELVVRWGDTLLTGFENHAGGTYLGAMAQPLGQVVIGHGNNGDGTEGVRLGNAIGTHLRGPVLPRNPALADFLIAAALTHRYGGAELTPLDDELELTAHHDATARAYANARAGRSRLRLAAFGPDRRAASRRTARLRGARPAPSGRTLTELAQARPVLGGRPARSTRPPVGRTRTGRRGRFAATSPAGSSTRVMTPAQIAATRGEEVLITDLSDNRPSSAKARSGDHR
jgi:CobQ-like glutamine amidotransferase family enzyme